MLKHHFNHTDSADSELHHYNAYNKLYNNSENELKDSDSEVDDGINDIHHFVEEIIKRSLSFTQALIH